MWFWIVSAILVAFWLIAVVLITRDEWSDGEEKAWNITGASVVAALLWAVVTGLVFSGISATTGTGSYVTGTETVKLQALNTGNAAEGRFFLGSGRYNDNQVFEYLYQREDGGFVLDRAYADSSIVYENNDVDPYLKITEVREKHNPDWHPSPIFYNSRTEYQFYVPEGSVLNNYEVSP